MTTILKTIGEGYEVITSRVFGDGSERDVSTSTINTTYTNETRKTTLWA